MLKKIKLKIAVIGPPKSGKSSFINNIREKEFNPDYHSTHSYQLSLHKFSKYGSEYEIHLWQCGSEHMKYNKHIRHAFFKNCSAAFLTFDLSDEEWQDKVSQWVEEAYQFDCFLVYAIGTKKDIYLKQKFIEKHGRESIPDQKLSDSLLESSGVQTLNQMQINQFFAQFQIKHFFQAATERVHSQIRNAFITIEDDQQKLTRSSLALGRRFDNSVIDNKSVRDQEILKCMTQEPHFYSVKQQTIDPKQ